VDNFSITPCRIWSLNDAAIERNDFINMAGLYALPVRNPVALHILSNLAITIIDLVNRRIASN